MKKYFCIILLILINNSFAGPIIGIGGGGSSMVMNDFSHESFLSHRSLSRENNFLNLESEKNLVENVRLLDIMKDVNANRVFENLDNGNRINLSNYREYISSNFTE